MPGKASRRNPGMVRQRKNGTWEARITIGYRNGKQLTRSVYADTENKAEELLNKLLAVELGDTDERIENIKLRELFDLHLESKEHVTDSTLYKNRLEMAPVLERLGHHHIRKLRRSQIQNLFDEFRRAGKPSADGRKRALRILRATLDFGVHRSYIPSNPTDGIAVQGMRALEVTPWTAAEVELFLRVASGQLRVPYRFTLKRENTPVASREDLIIVDPDDAIPHMYYGLFYLLLSTGMRRGEALGLQWKHIHESDQLIQIVQHLAASGGFGQPDTIRATKTKRSTRTIHISVDTVAVLQQQRVHQTKLAGVMGTDWQNHADLVFTTSVGTPISPRNALRAFQALIRPLGITSRRLHDLRHTFASMALRRGLPVDAVSRHLGHADTSTTQRIYRHVYPDELGQVVLSMAELTDKG